MAIDLIVREDFRGHRKGDRITDPLEIAEAHQFHPAHVIKVASLNPISAPEEPAPEPPAPPKGARRGR